MALYNYTVPILRLYIFYSTRLRSHTDSYFDQAGNYPDGVTTNRKGKETWDEEKGKKGERRQIEFPSDKTRSRANWRESSFYAARTVPPL